LRQREEDGLKQKHLHICADERVYSYAYPEIDFTENFFETLKSAKRGGEYISPVTYRLNGLDEVVDGICGICRKDATEPFATFNLAGEPFTYHAGEDGEECDRKRLKADIESSLAGGCENGGFENVYVQKNKVFRKNTLNGVRIITKKLYSFTTYFDGENVDRSANIRLAAQKINGTVLESGEVFSFNKTVGARTQENGYRPAKIIQDGKFVEGYGGGVCQVSTTLYNAALLSGLEIAEYHPHSLQVSYVAPSRDAMVSGNYFDLKFKNNRKTPIYVRVNCTLSSVCCTVYGESDGCEYSFTSNVTEKLPRPEAVVVKGEEEKVISYGRDGTKSEGYLVKRVNGIEESELIRRDEYMAVADVIQTVEEKEDGEENA
ncbi:MAG: VanW family protein, partial [Clostridia bacterium]|nr:VanW family protein [Clostridia bacterium]